MRVNMKHVIEIAGGLIIGALASDAVNAVNKLAKKEIAKLQAKKKETKEEPKKD